MDVSTWTGGTGMEQVKDPEITGFHSLLAAIRKESALLEKVIMAEDAEKEENEMLTELDSAIQVQAFSTLSHLADYQAYGWRALIDE